MRAGKKPTKELKKDMSLDEFIAACLSYNEENGVDASNLSPCPVHVYAGKINKPCFASIPGIKDCPICKKPMCPSCGNHNVVQLSRVTGYIQEVGGWNAGKRQELKDRKRYGIGEPTQ